MQENLGIVLLICESLIDSSAEKTSRIADDSALRQMLLRKQVIAPTQAYPVAHSWCRFYRGEGLRHS